MARKGRLRYCSCCGVTVTQDVYEEHEGARQIRVLEADVAKLVLLDPSPSVSAKAQHTIPTATPLDAMAMFRELSLVEEETAKQYREYKEVLKRFTFDGPVPIMQGPIQTRTQALPYLRTGREWLKEYATRIETIQDTQDQANRIYTTGLLDRLRQQIHDLDEGITDLSKRLDRSHLRQDRVTYDTGRYFSNPIQVLNPASLLVLFTVVVLNLIANITRAPCNFVLRMARLALQVVMNTDSNAFPDLPQDIRAARKAFKLDPVLTVYATCSCGLLHPPVQSKPFPIYPATCACGRKLTKIGHANGVAIRKPLKPYAMQNFTDFCARLYSRPGIEELIRRQHTHISGSDTIKDITEARAYQNLRGPDGKRFIDCSTEIRTIWSLSYDGYNPLMNKAAGKSTSVGSLAMACISLPECLRYRPEYLYLAGLVPGPKQPTADGLNPFLSPLIDHLHMAYHQGTFYERTYEHSEGIVSREALLPTINDLPAARKIVGAAGHSANILCMLCHVELPNINNINMSTPDWRGKTTEQFRKAAQEWKDAPTKGRQKALYKKNGVRWSELLRLEYWDPLQNTVIDRMHNLFLGLVRHHFREVIGTKWDEKQAENEMEISISQPPPEKQLLAGRKLLVGENLTLAQLERLSLPVLCSLCDEKSVKPVLNGSKRVKKRDYAIALLSCGSSATKVRVSDTPRFHNLEENDLNLISPELGNENFAKPNRPMLQHANLKSIQDDIKKTLRPSNQSSPPSNFGSPSHGKLKADQWRACIEFDLPVSLLKLWGSSDDPEKQRALESTFLLSMAIRFATSHRTSALHQRKYLDYMKRYLEAIREIRPHDDLHPNHHNALHLPLFLESFGPLHGWWMFPFERLIGILQKHHTNFKFGELEETVIRNFCAASQLKNFLDRPSVPEILKQSMDIMRQCLPESVKGSMLVNAGDAGAIYESKPQMKHLNGDIVSKFTSGNLQGVAVETFRRIRQFDCNFATKDTSRAHSVVFIPRANSHLNPGVIREIFKHQNTTYLVVHCYARSYRSYFDRYPDFGASVWSKELDSHPEIVPLSSNIYSGHLREWDTSTLVVRPLIKDF